MRFTVTAEGDKFKNHQINPCIDSESKNMFPVVPRDSENNSVLSIRVTFNGLNWFYINTVDTFSLEVLVNFGRYLSLVFIT